MQSLCKSILIAQQFSLYGLSIVPLGAAGGRTASSVTAEWSAMVKSSCERQSGGRSWLSATERSADSTRPPPVPAAIDISMHQDNFYSTRRGLSYCKACVPQQLESLLHLGKANPMYWQVPDSCTAWRWAVTG